MTAMTANLHTPNKNVKANISKKNLYDYAELSCRTDESI